MNFESVYQEHEEPKDGLSSVIKLIHETPKEDMVGETTLLAFLGFCASLVQQDPVLAGVPITAYQDAGHNVAKLVELAASVARDNPDIRALLESLRDNLKGDSSFRGKPLGLYVELAEAQGIAVSPRIKADAG